MRVTNSRQRPCPTFLGRASSLLRVSGGRQPTAGRMPLPRPRFRELVCGGLGDGGYAPESIRIGEARIAGACQRLECGIEFDMDAVVVAVHVSPHPAGVFVEGDRGDLVDGAVAVAEDEAISVGQRVGGDPWCDDCGHRWFLSVSSGITLMVLKRAADATFDVRCGQVMADTLVERVTGRPAEEAESVALNLVMSDQVLWGRDNAPAELDGYGPIRPRWRSVWCGMRWSMSDRWRRCGGYIDIRRACLRF